MSDRWFDYFWTTPVAGVPPEVAFGQFSVAHLATLAVLGVGIFLLVRAYRRAPSPTRRRIRLVVGISALTLEVLRQISYIAAGDYPWEILPLHLCAMSTFATFIDSVRANSWCREFLYALGVWGAPCALLFPDWASQPLFNIYTWQSFVIHSLITAYPLMLLAGGEFRPRVRNLWKVVVILAVCVGVSLYVNARLGTNFWFLNTGSPGSPLEPIQALTGAFYIPFLAAAVAVVWAVMYVPWEVSRVRGRHPANAGS